MNIVYFIRLLLKNALILIISPILLFGIVFYLTRDQPQSFTSSTTVYTGIATGSSIVSLEDSRFDLFGTRTAFDNLINIIESRGTAEEVGLRLFTSHMVLDEPSKDIISPETYKKLMAIVPKDVKELVVKGNFEKTYEAFRNYKNKNHTNFIYELIRLNHPHYSYEKILSNLKASRVQSSDIIEISYSSDDQGICLQTLQLITDVFSSKYSKIKVNQSDAVLRYFQGQLDDAKDKLDQSENELLEFNKANNIINYYEQTKHIASEKEHFDLEFQRLKMQHAASESVLKILENKLTGQQEKQLNNTEIIEMRDKLAEINLEIAMKTYQLQLDSVQEAELTEELAELQIESFEIQEQLRNSIDKAYFIDNSTEGVASTTILQEWLDKVIEYESTGAKLIVGEERKREFIELFSEYAPLGATMKRLERKINVAEREYLSILNSLNTAKLKQQNVELNSNLKIAEPPFYPIKSRPGKRKYILLIALILGFILPAFSIIVLDFLDSNIRNARRIESASKLKVVGSFPSLFIKDKRTDYEKLKTIATEKIVQRLLILSNEYNKNEPIQFALISNQVKEGKTTLANAILNKLENLGYLSLFVSKDNPDESSNVSFIKYQMGEHFQKVNNIKNLNADFENQDLNRYDFIFIELPSIIQNVYPVNLIKNIHKIFITVRANRKWSNADNNSVDDLLKITKNNEPLIILNGVEIPELEDEIGEIPGKKSFFRRFIKRMVCLEFFSKERIK